jgi:membrane protein YqaA with SNARE-associated domain
MDLIALFFWSFLAATILPLGSEPALVAIVHRRETVVLPVLIATLGNYLGACTTYALAMTVSGSVKSERAIRRMERASEMIRKYGAPALVLSWVPLLGDAIVAAAGAARMHFLPFSLWTIAGKAGRYAALALIVHRGFNAWSFR